MIKKANLFRISAFIPTLIKPGDVKGNLEKVSKLFQNVDDHSDLVVVSYGSLSGIIDSSSDLYRIKDITDRVWDAMCELQKRLTNTGLDYSILIPERDTFFLIEKGHGGPRMLKDGRLKFQNHRIIQLFSGIELPKQPSSLIIYFQKSGGENVYIDEFVGVVSGLNHCFAMSVDVCQNLSDTEICWSGIIISENGENIETGEDDITGFNTAYFDVDLDRCYKNEIENIENTYELSCTDYSEAGIVHEFCTIDNYNTILSGRDHKVIFRNQVRGTISKLVKLPAPVKCVVGVSGGSDSTLTLLVLREAYDTLGWDPKNIVGVTLPCFGTTERTKGNALKLMEALGITSKEINITESVTSHLGEIEHLLTDTNNTYENAQARMRTLTLFDYANDIGGVVIGTGDYSEEWLGWCTYGGDNLCVYNPNANILKTQVLGIIRCIAEDPELNNLPLKSVLEDILDTPISPELIRGGNKSQKSEDIIGPYLLHDFFICGFLDGWSGEKIRYLANEYLDYSKDEIEKWFEVNVRRFSGSQFKRAMKIPGPQANLIDTSLDDLPNDLSII